MKQLSLLAMLHTGSVSCRCTVPSQLNPVSSPSSKQHQLNPGQARAPCRCHLCSEQWVSLRAGTLVLFCCDTPFQRSSGHRTVRRAGKSMHFLLSYQCKVSKCLNVSGQQCRCELQLCNPTPPKLPTVAPLNPASERRKVPLQPESVQHSPSASAGSPYFERQAQTHFSKSVPKINQGSEGKRGD